MKVGERERERNGRKEDTTQRTGTNTKEKPGTSM